MNLRSLAPFVLVLALAGCGGDNEPDPLCGVASQELMAEIATGPDEGQVQRQIDFDGEITPVLGATYPYEEGGGGTGTAIAMQFTVPGVDDAVGIWAQTSEGGIFVSDAQAATFTAWPQSLSDGTEILSYPSDAGSAAVECLDAQSEQ